jgi:hypothetical protein
MAFFKKDSFRNKSLETTPLKIAPLRNGYLI